MHVIIISFQLQITRRFPDHYKVNEIQAIQSKIYEIRGQRVMLDFDLAHAYGIETSQLKRQVRRNIERFEGDDFMFEVAQEKGENLWNSQRFVVSLPQNKNANERE